MNNEIKKVLVALSNLYNEDQAKQVKIARLEQITRIPSARLIAHLKFLKDGKYVQSQKNHKGEDYFSLTMNGIEKAEEWKDDLYQKSFSGKLLSVGKWIMGGLAATALGFCFWYFGLTPETANIQPIDAQIPIKVYDVGTYPSIVPTVGWYSFTAPKSYPVLIDKDANIYDEKILRKILGDYSPATFDGNVNFMLAIENVATKYQVDIQTVDVIVRTENTRRIEDLYSSPVWGLGGGGVWEFGVSVSPDAGKPLEDGSRIYRATLFSNDKDVNYIFVEPGKRETISFSVKLENPGKYVLTPLITYSFRSKTDKLRVNPYPIVYPELYRSWVINPSYMYVAGLSDQLDTSEFIVNNNTGLVEQEKQLPFDNKACFSQKKWVFFTSTMLGTGVIHETFVINTDGGNLRLIKSQYGDPREPLVTGWSNDGNLLLRHGYLDKNNVDTSVYEYFSPATGESLNLPTDINKTIEWAPKPLAHYSDPIVSPNGEKKAYNQSGGKYSIDCNPQDLGQLYISNLDGSQEQQITSIAGIYRSPAWSPNGQFIAYASARAADNGSVLSCDYYGDEFNIYVMDLISGREYQLTDNSFRDLSPAWSNDGQWVISGGARLAISKFDGSCSQDILVPRFGEISNASLQP